MGAVIKDLKREVRRQNRRLRKAEGELQKTKKNYADAAAEINRLRGASRQLFRDYNTKKYHLKKELEELQKRSSEKSWSQTAKISSLEVELSAAQERIHQLENTSAWSTSREQYGWEWSRRFSELQNQLHQAEASYMEYRYDWSCQVATLKKKLLSSDEEVARLQKQLADRRQASSSRESEELLSSMTKLSSAFDRESAELKQLKIQMAYERNAVKDAEAESAVLRKRLREAEEEAGRLRRLFRENLTARRELEQKVKELKESLILAGGSSPKLEEAEEAGAGEGVGANEGVGADDRADVDEEAGLHC